jgi:hypothetical protein
MYRVDDHGSHWFVTAKLGKVCASEKIPKAALEDLYEQEVEAMLRSVKERLLDSVVKYRVKDAREPEPEPTTEELPEPGDDPYNYDPVI